MWYKNGELHRDDVDENGRVLPAYVESDGHREWFKNGKRHRDDLDENGKVLPAIVFSNGTKEW